MNASELLLATQLEQDGIAFASEYVFATPRRWRFDIALTTAMVAVEIEGGRWIAGRHTRGAGFERDLDKYNEATLRGWRVLRVTPEMVDDGRALDLVRRALTG